MKGLQYRPTEIAEADTIGYFIIRQTLDYRTIIGKMGIFKTEPMRFWQAPVLKPELPNGP